MEPQAWGRSQPELSPREVAVAFNDNEKTFVSEASRPRIFLSDAPLTRSPSPRRPSRRIGKGIGRLHDDKGR